MSTQRTPADARRRPWDSHPLCRLLVLLVVLGAFLAVYRPDAARAARFAVTNVSLSASINAYASGISNTGLILGTQYAAVPQFNAYVINADGTGGTLLTPSGQSLPVDISPDGHVFARNSTGYSVTGTFIYTRQQGAVPVSFFGESINDAGTLVAPASNGAGYRAARFAAPSGPVEYLPLPAGTTDAYGYGINAAGDVVGSARNASTSTRYLMSYRNGAASKYALPAGWTSGALTDVNAAGQAIGTVSKFTNTFVSRGVMLDTAGIVRELPTLSSNPDALSEADAINRHGTAVGWSDSPSGGRRAVLYDNNQAIDLNTLIDPASGWTLGAAYGINDLGQIVGQGTIGGQVRAFALTPAASTEWTASAGGLWATDANWSAGAPNASNVAVRFAGGGTGARTVSIATQRAAGSITFDSVGAYTIARAAGVVGAPGITLDVIGGTGRAGITVAQGAHTISVPLTLGSDTDVDISTWDSALTLNKVSAAGGQVLRKRGPADLSVDSIAGATLVIDEGRVHLTSPTSTSVVRDLVLSGNGTLDLGTAALVVDYAADSGTPFGRLLGYLRSASHDGAWDWPGITGPGLGPNAGRAIGILDNVVQNLTTFRGQPVDASAVLMSATYLGDANLDGLVNDDDLALLIGGTHRAAGTATWRDGDFNYDGTINPDDFALYSIGAAAQQAAGGATPEPTVLAPVLAVAGIALRRRSR